MLTGLACYSRYSFTLPYLTIPYLTLPYLISYCIVLITTYGALPTEKQVGEFGALAGEPPLLLIFLHAAFLDPFLDSLYSRDLTIYWKCNLKEQCHISGIFCFPFFLPFYKLMDSV